MTELSSVGILGFGEVGTTLCDAFIASGHQFAVWDDQFPDAQSVPSKRAQERGVTIAVSAADLCARSEIIISAVTAGSALDALRSCGVEGARRGFFLDLNSVSPNTKCELAAVAAETGFSFVEAAVMSPIQPKGVASPILLGGPFAEDFLPVARSLGFSALSVASDEFGKAAATKMCRSVLIKGMEALVTESMVEARYYGVTDAVLHSLGNLLPRDDWPEFSHYMMSRSIEHGIRRSEEMFEAASSVADAGLEPLMTQSCAQRQAQNAQFASALPADDVLALAQNILTQIRPDIR